jgi:23S rRNA (uracil1939-C5)-methyltransferase
MNALCPHFGTCGGCLHQDVADADYRALKRQLVVVALARHGIETQVDEIVEVPPGTRRRAVLKAVKGEGTTLGFHAARSHDIVDLMECRVLTPALAALLPRLREMLAALLAPNEDAELRLTETDNGFDLGLRWRKPNDPPTLAALAEWAGKLGLVRISAHGETVVSLGKPAIRLGKAEVTLPPETFLQPTRPGEAVLQDFVRKALKSARQVADLFCGCGTFSFPLAEKSRVHAVELEASMLDALAAAAKATPGLKPISTEKRNLFRRPLGEFELNGYDGLCLDPPRAGALEQVRQLAKSKLARIAYVSCDAGSFARDARLLLDGGYTLKRVLPVDQFLWSAHIELAGEFTR